MEKEKHTWHGAHHYSDRIHLAFILFLIFGVFVLLFGYFSLNSNKIPKYPVGKIPITPILTPTPTGSDKTFCTLDAKQCPDGTYVGRIAPECEFAKCPE